MRKSSTKACLLALALASAAASSSAQISGNTATAVDSVPEIIPYHGHLDVNGQVYDGVADFTFSIYGAASGAAPALWTSSLLSGVPVYAGEFQVDLGSIGPNFLNLTTPDGHPLFQTDTLYVGVSVVLHSPDVTPTIVLAGRQRLLATPYAITARQAESMNLTDDSTVGQNLFCGAATFSGGTNSLQATTTGTLTPNALTSAGSMSLDTYLMASHFQNHADVAGCAAGTAGCPMRGFAVVDTAVLSYGMNTATLAIFVPSGAYALCGLKRTVATYNPLSNAMTGGGCAVAPVGAAGGTQWTLTAAAAPGAFTDSGQCQMSCLVVP